jgi:hypothetical protein
MPSEISSGLSDAAAEDAAPEQPRRRRRRSRGSRKSRFSPRTRLILKLVGWAMVVAGAGYVALLLTIMVKDPRWQEPLYTPPAEQPPQTTPGEQPPQTTPAEQPSPP